MADGRNVSFDVESGDNVDENGTIDADTATDQELLRGKKTWSKKQFRRITKLFDQQPSRKKILSQIQDSTDLKIWNVEVYNKAILCAKVFNPAILDTNSGKWEDIAQVQRLEIEDPEGILTEIPKHLALEMKFMDSFSMTWTKVKTLPNSLFHSNLRTLSIQRNQIKSLNGIEMAENLETLDASSNLITSLPNGIGQLFNLATLNLSGNGIKELPANMGSLGKLKSLDCSCNKLKVLPVSICNMLELTVLDVSNNYLSFLPDTIGNLPKLEDMRARSNQLCQLPKDFGHLENLKSLLLGKNQFEEVPKQLASLPDLQNLNMKDNRIKTMRLPIASLKSLILDGNLFEEITNSILKCSNLEMLWMQNNKLTEISKDIKLLKNLRALYLSDNNISSVPNSMGELDKLKHLSLCSTQIETIPFVIANMHNVTVELDESLRQKVKENRKTYAGGFGIVSRFRKSIDFRTDKKTVGASFGRPKERDRCLSQFPADPSGKGNEFVDEFSVPCASPKHDSIYPPKANDKEAHEMQTRQGLLVPKQIMQHKKDDQSTGNF